MKKKTENVTDAQGVEVANKKEQKSSVSYALKAVNGHLETLGKAELISAPTLALMYQEIEAAKREYVRREFGI